MNPYASQQGSSNLGMSGNAYGGSNPYLQQNIDATMGDLSRNYNNTVAPQRAGAMAQSGSFGNSGQQAMQLEDQRNLGQTMANTSAQMRGQDYTQQQAMYQQDQQNSLANRSLDQQNTLANRGMDITTQGQNQSYNLGMANNATNQQSVNNQYALGNQSNATTQRGQDQNYSLGQAQNANTANQIGANYDLGLRGNDYQFANLDYNINNSNASNQLAGARFGLDAYTAQQNGNNLGLNAANTIQNQPLNYFNSFSGQANSMANGYGTSTGSQYNPGNPLLGSIAGADLGNQFYNQYKTQQY